MPELNDYVGKEVYIAQTTGTDRVEFLGRASVEKEGSKYRFKFSDREVSVSDGGILRIVDQTPTRIILRRNKK